MTVAVMPFTMPPMLGKVRPVPMVMVLFIVPPFMMLFAVIMMMVVVNGFPLHPAGCRGIVYDRRWQWRRCIDINRRRRWRCYINRCRVNWGRDRVQPSLAENTRGKPR